MRLLIFTQKVDKTDPVLGFFHSWLIEISKKAESVEVICLEKGIFNLPKNVTVYSLGKEKNVSKLVYIKNFYHYLFLIRNSYDRVFIHMNQEYILLGGLYWKLKAIPVYLWRNHPNGSIATIIAVLLSNKVFCTSTQSFTKGFKKTTIMPVGVDTKIFRPISNVVRKKYSVCMVGRISPIKHIELALEAVALLVSSGTQLSLSIIGSPYERDIEYFNKMKKYVIDHDLSTIVHFMDAVLQEELPAIYSGYEVCLNLTESGSFDKTIVESSSCGAIPLVSNISLRNILPEICITEALPRFIAESLKKLSDPHQKMEIQNELKFFVESNSLDSLVTRFFEEIT